jgi:RNA polymerase sigma-70 factor (ECF subfamily)
MVNTGMNSTQERTSAAADGDRAAAFEELARTHLAAAYRLAAVILGSPSDAEDATHDAFVRAWHAWGSLRDPAAFQPWFDRIVVNTCRNRLRQRRPVAGVDLTDEPGFVTADGSVGLAERDDMERALARLSPDHRIVIVLRFYRDYRIEDIAQRTGARPGTVKSRLHHALSRLEQLLAPPEVTR